MTGTDKPAPRTRSARMPASEPAPAAAAPADPAAARQASRYVVGEVVPTTDGIWIRLINTVPANGRHAAVKAVVGTREGRWFVCAESTSEIVTYGPPPDPTPTLVASQSVSAVLAEPAPAPSPAQLGLGDPGVDPQGPGEHTGTIGVRDDFVPVQPDLPIADDPAPTSVDERTAREGQPIPLPDEAI